MQAQSVTTSKIMRRPVGDDRLSYGSGPVKVIMIDGVLLPEPIFVTPDAEGIVSHWNELRDKAHQIRPNNPVHHQPTQKHTGPRPDSIGCAAATDGLHAWMKNGVHPVSKRQRWKCLRCKALESTEGE